MFTYYLVRLFKCCHQVTTFKKSSISYEIFFLVSILQILMSGVTFNIVVTKWRHWKCCHQLTCTYSRGKIKKLAGLSVKISQVHRRTCGVRLTGLIKPFCKKIALYIQWIYLFLFYSYVNAHPFKPSAFVPQNSQKLANGTPVRCTFPHS